MGNSNFFLSSRTNDKLGSEFLKHKKRRLNSHFAKKNIAVKDMGKDLELNIALRIRASLRSI